MNNDTIFITSHTVRSYELDSFGHVNNAIFMNFLERARGDYLVQKNLKFNDFSVWNKFPLVFKASIEFKYPANADDVLTIKGWFSSNSVTRFSIRYEISLQENSRIIATAETQHVFVDENNKPTRMPKIFAEKFLTQINCK